MNIQTKKIKLIQWLSSIEDVNLIDKLMSLKKTASKDWWLEISENEKSSIEKGIVDADAENLNSQSEARNLYKKWL